MSGQQKRTAEAMRQLSAEGLKKGAGYNREVCGPGIVQNRNRKLIIPSISES